MKFKQIYELQIRDFSEIPKKILENLDKMGEDNSIILNEYEGSYLNFIFSIDPQNYNLVGKKVAFTKEKKDYFKETRERFHRNSTTIGGSSLYIFDSIQKTESGGYDAFVTMWNKFIVPTEKIVEKLNRKQ